MRVSFQEMSSRKPRKNTTWMTDEIARARFAVTSVRTWSTSTVARLMICPARVRWK
jgi:hypothetical protein